MKMEKLLRNLGIIRLNAELNLICHLLALLGAHHILHVGRIRVKFHICVFFVCLFNGDLLAVQVMQHQMGQSKLITNLK